MNFSSCDGNPFRSTFLLKPSCLSNEPPRLVVHRVYDRRAQTLRAAFGELQCRYATCRALIDEPCSPRELRQALHHARAACVQEPRFPRRNPQKIFVNVPANPRQILPPQQQGAREDRCPCVLFLKANEMIDTVTCVTGGRASSKRFQIGSHVRGILTCQPEGGHGRTQGFALASHAGCQQGHHLLLRVLGQTGDTRSKFRPRAPLRRLAHRNRCALECPVEQKLAVGAARRVTLDAHRNVVSNVASALGIAP